MTFRTLLTDNATLSDAAIGFYAIQNQYDLSKSILPNWLKFLENSILYEEIVADNNVFSGNIWAQKLKEDFKNVSGIDIDVSTRQKINQAAGQRISKLDDMDFENIQDNLVRSNVKRLLFYLGLSNEIDSTYSPSTYRNNLIQSLSQVFDIEDTKTELESKLLNNVIAAARSYARNVERESGIRLIVAELPPISSLVISHAIKCGSWTEAILEIKQKQTAMHFREWAAEVSDSLRNGNSNALSRLSKVNRFVEGWGNNDRKGLEHKATFSIGAVFNTLGLSVNTGALSIKIANPFPKKHIVFLNNTFQSLISVQSNWSKIKTVKM